MVTNSEFAPYATAHQNTKGPGDARPTAMQIIKDNDVVGKYTDKVMLVTGASSGIGVETARALHETGAKVFVLARDMKKMQDVVKDIQEKSSSKAPIEMVEMHMDSLASVRKAADEILSKTDKLNVMVNNAGVMAIQKRTLSEDGQEMQFATNHLAHFLLFTKLAPLLVKSSTPEFNSRVVNLSSSGHLSNPVFMDDVTMKDNYDAWASYGQSKTANIWMANYIDRVYGPKGVHATSVHPGGIWTPLQRHLPQEFREKWIEQEGVNDFLKSTEQGAATSTWAAVGTVWEGKGGKFLENCQVSPAEKPDPAPLNGGYHAPWAYDPEQEDKLWKLSCEIVGVENKA